LKAGNAGITATAGGKSASIIVTVKEVGPVLQSIQITGNGVTNNALTILHNQHAQLAAKLTPADAVVGALGWSSSDASVATVDGNGYVTAKKPGVTAITVTAGNQHAAIILTVNKAETTFPDVPKTHHFFKEIEWIADKGITTGNWDGTFGPSNETTRAQTVVFLYRLAVQRGDKGAENYRPSAADYKRFPDVKEGTFGAREILWAANIGLTTGRPDGTFGGDVPVTRDQMVTFLNRYAIMEGDETASNYKPTAEEYEKFSDVKRGTFAATAILWGAKVGIVNGNNGMFSGGDTTLREQMAAFLYRLNVYLDK
ncbi:MAG: hypothetical protein GX068_06460, partial [Bifidobacterium pseudolongum subsp. globosum]|nr:hypothetical protein [Bifidobacterium pseudolongum subsp. globosum]